MTAESRGTVHVVDDDARVRAAFLELLQAAGFRVRTHASAKGFLAAFEPDEPGCLVLDLRLRGESGLDLQREVRRRGVLLPIIFVTGHGSVRASVRALRAGAIDFLEKPVRPRDLIARVREALERGRHDHARAASKASIERRFSALSPRERQVAAQLLTGATSKEIAGVLGVSVRTAEGHRRMVLRKMDVPSAAALVRLVASGGHAALLGE
jgi:two-component system, LuxR family, response regulator FixJ